MTHFQFGIPGVPLCGDPDPAAREAMSAEWRAVTCDRCHANRHKLSVSIPIPRELAREYGWTDPLASRFRREGDYIVGHGLTITAPGGLVVMSADLLNRLVDLLRDQKMLGDDDASHIVAQERRDRARIEAAKDDLREQLGLSADPDERAALDEALHRTSRKS